MLQEETCPLSIMDITKRKFPNISVISLIAVNLFPLFGVLFLHWSLFAVMFLYWLESAIIGFFNIPKMVKAEGKNTANFTINDKPISKVSKITAIPFFIIHYGMFMAVHGVFVFVLFGPINVSAWELFLGFLFLFISHGLSYKFNFLANQEFKKVSFGEQMMKPYSRIIIMHLTILFGGAGAKALGAPPLALIVMIVIKTAIDLASHMREHDLFTNWRFNT